MSAFIGSVKGPNHNSPHDAIDVRCSRGGVEITTLGELPVKTFSLDPIAARNFAAMLVRASEEVERMRAKAETMSGCWFDRWTREIDERERPRVEAAIERDLAATIERFKRDGIPPEPRADEFEPMIVTLARAKMKNEKVTP